MHYVASLSITTISALSWFRAVKDRLRSFECSIGRSIGFLDSAESATPSPLAPYHLHLIPDYYNEVFLGTPTDEVRTNKQPASGLIDMPFFLLKTRLASANEQNGDYVVSAYIAGQAPVGAKAFTANAYYLTPTIATGKGWGNFDIQATVGTPWPLSNLDKLGGQLAASVTFQYHLLEYLWPEFSLNDTYWFNGPRRGLDQLLIGPDLIIGPFPIPGTKLAASLLAGYQFAVTPQPAILNPLTPLYNHSWQITARVFF